MKRRSWSALNLLVIFLALVSIFQTKTYAAVIGSVTINGGADFTNKTAVFLSIVASDPVNLITGACISNTSTCTAWQTFPAASSVTANKSWTLTSVQGNKTVYALFRDPSGNVSNLTGNITLDTTKPTGTITINSGATTTNSPNVTVNLSPNDVGGSGIAY